MPKTEEYTLAVDLGTTNSVAAVWRGRPQVLPIQNVAPLELLRSVVLIGPGGEPLVGETAWNQRLRHPDRFIQSVKSKMGTDWTVTVDGVVYTPEQISSFILKEIITRATAALERDRTCPPFSFRNLIVTVPARFSPKARLATEQACVLAGYPAGDWRDPGTHQLMLESDAAALAYLRDDPRRQKVLVYDMGGGTFDVTMMEFQGTGEGKDPFIRLGTPGGDPRLGGDVFDERLFAKMVEHFNIGGDKAPRQRTYPAYLDLTMPAPDGADPAAWAGAQQRLLDEARFFKQTICDPSLPNDYPNEAYLPELLDRAQSAPFTMSRRDFTALIQDRLDASGEAVRALVREAGLSPGDIDRVILAGGSTRIPAVKELVKSIFGYEPHSTLEADKAIAIGAAIFSELRKAVKKGSPMLEQKLTVPIGLKITKRIRESIIGDAIYTEREERDLFEAVLPRGMVFPGARKKTVTTVRDNQRVLRFQIYQNDQAEGAGTCAPSDFMAWFEMTLPPAAVKPKGQAKIEMTFTLNANGTAVDVSAVETTTGLAVERRIELAQRGMKPPEDEGGTGLADIAIAMDTTGSMGPHIAAMQRLTNEFAAKVGESGIDFRLALIDYRDLKLNERLTVYPFTSDVAEFQRRVDKLAPGGGGDEPESTLDAIERALALEFRSGAQKIVIVITDASTHDPSQSGASLPDVAEQLRQQSAALYIITGATKKDRQYGALVDAVGLGRCYEMGRSFDDILSDVATEIRDITVE